jgi:hypothetical protein
MESMGSDELHMPVDNRRQPSYLERRQSLGKIPSPRGTMRINGIALPGPGNLSGLLAPP